MAVATKTARTFQSSTSNAAGGTTTGTAVNLTTALGCAVVLKVTNGATGPTVGCTVKIEVSNDTTNWFTWYAATASVTASAVNEFSVDLPPAIMYARSKFEGNTGQAVTVEAVGHELTSIG